MYTAELEKPKRHFLPEDFVLTDWNGLEPYLRNLEERVLDSRQALEKWLHDLSELEAVLSEDSCWRQIRMTCDTENKELEEAFRYFVMEIQPHIQPYADRLNRKLVECPYTGELDKRQFFTYIRRVKKQIELFRESNIPLQAELSVLAQQYGMIAGKMTVIMDGKEYTLQQAAKFLENPQREVREEAYRKIQDRRLQDKDALGDLYSQLIGRRHQVALNAGFKKKKEGIRENKRKKNQKNQSKKRG